jgi:hypothetical protein
MTGWQNCVVTVGDWLLSWTLGASRDLTLLALAGITTAALLVVRRVFGQQQRLRRIAADERRLRALRSDARSTGDDDAIRRHRHVRRLVAIERLRAEIRPGLVGLLLLAAVMTWGNHRLDHFPIRDGESFRLSVTLPASAVGSLVHVVPQSGLSCEGSWILPVSLTAVRSTPLGRATWQLQADSAATIDRITVRYQGKTFRHPIVIDGRIAPLEFVRHGGDTVTQIHLRTYRPFGWIPGLERAGIAPWLAGLLMLVVVGYFGTKRLLRMP